MTYNWCHLCSLQSCFGFRGKQGEHELSLYDLLKFVGRRCVGNKHKFRKKFTPLGKMAVTEVMRYHDNKNEKLSCSQRYLEKFIFDDFAEKTVSLNANLRAVLRQLFHILRIFLSISNFFAVFQNNLSKNFLRWEITNFNTPISRIVNSWSCLHLSRNKLSHISPKLLGTKIS